MSEEKKKSELEVTDDEADIEFSATTAVFQLSSDMKKALEQNKLEASNDQENSPQNNVEETAPIKELRPGPLATKGQSSPTALASAAANVKGDKSKIPQERQAKAPIEKTPTPQMAPQAQKAQAPVNINQLEKAIEGQVAKALEKLGGPSTAATTPLALYKAQEEVERFHAKRNKDLEMELYNILRKYTDHPDFTHDLERVLKLLAEHANNTISAFKKSA